MKSHTLVSQSSIPFTLHVRSRPLGEVLNELFEQTGVSLAVDPRATPQLRTLVSASFTQPTPLADVLSVVLDNGKLRWVRVGRTTFITSPENAFRILAEEFAPRSPPWDLMPPISGGSSLRRR